jgi:hypothetical protein
MPPRPLGPRRHFILESPVADIADFGSLWQRISLERVTGTFFRGISASYFLKESPPPSFAEYLAESHIHIDGIYCTSPHIGVIYTRRKMRLIEGNAKCRHLNKLTCKGT